MMAPRIQVYTCLSKPRFQLIRESRILEVIKRIKFDCLSIESDSGSLKDFRTLRTLVSLNKYVALSSFEYQVLNRSDGNHFLESYFFRLNIKVDGFTQEFSRGCVTISLIISELRSFVSYLETLFYCPSAYLAKPTLIKRVVNQIFEYYPICRDIHVGGYYSNLRTVESLKFQFIFFLPRMTLTPKHVRFNFI